MKLFLIALALASGTASAGRATPEKPFCPSGWRTYAKCTKQNGEGPGRLSICAKYEVEDELSVVYGEGFVIEARYLVTQKDARMGATEYHFMKPNQEKLSVSVGVGPMASATLREFAADNSVKDVATYTCPTKSRK